MKSKFKKVITSILVVSSLAVSITGLNASAYNETASMILRNVSGAPSNITSGSLTITYNSNNSYYTSYDFAYNNSSATLKVSTTNAISNTSVSLNRNKKSASLNAVARYSYITFSGNLSTSPNESGSWSVS